MTEQFIKDQSGKTIGVFLNIEDYNQLLEQLDELRCQLGYEEALLETQSEIESEDYITLAQYLNANSK